MAGGGTAYVNAIAAVDELAGPSWRATRRPVLQIIANALTAPVKQIAANAGLDGSVILDHIKTSGKIGYGFDAYKEVYCDMMAVRHRRSYQGDPFRSGERLLHRRRPADHRVSGGRQAPACRRCRSRWRARYACRHVLIRTA